MPALRIFFGGKCMQSDPRPIFPTDHNAPAEWEVLNALIGEIYDSVLHPESWNETLARITGTLCPLSWEAAFILWERSEEHTSELQSLMRISYAVFCLKKKNNKPTAHSTIHNRQDTRKN